MSVSYQKKNKDCQLVMFKNISKIFRTTIIVNLIDEDDIMLISYYFNFIH